MCSGSPAYHRFFSSLASLLYRGEGAGIAPGGMVYGVAIALFHYSDGAFVLWTSLIERGEEEASFFSFFSVGYVSSLQVPIWDLILSPELLCNIKRGGGQ